MLSITPVFLLQSSLVKDSLIYNLKVVVLNLILSVATNAFQLFQVKKMPVACKVQVNTGSNIQENA